VCSHFLLQQAFQLLPAVIKTRAIGRVNDPDQRVRLLEVILPVCAQGLLAADVPCDRVRTSNGLRDLPEDLTNIQFVSFNCVSAACVVSITRHAYPS